MRLSRLNYVHATFILAIAPLAARADDARPTEGAPPPANAAAQLGAITVAAGPVQAQGQAQVTFTGATQAVPGAGCVSIDANGVKQVQNEEYGKKTSITDDPQKGIKIELTVHKGGTDDTKTYQAKDVKELEKKFPDGFKLYQQYLGNMAGPAMAGAATIVIQGQAALVPAGPGQPVPFPMPGGQGGVQVLQAQAQLVPAPGGGALPIEMATDALGQLRKDIKSAAASGVWKDAPLESRIALKKQAAAMRKQMQELENQLEGK
jgi:hypothetical protein